MRLLKLPLMILALLFAGQIRSQYSEIPLWAKGAPGSEGKTGKEKVREYKGEHIYSNIHNPSITVCLPPKDKATGTAIVVAPGGGHRELWFTHEGLNIAKWFNEQGIAVFILKYRLARDSNSTYSVEKESLADIQRAIRTVRQRAGEWQVDTAKIGVMGFSAGGQLAALAAMRFDAGNPQAADPIDKQSSRPAFQVLVYPGGSKSFTVADNAPPVFLLAGANDPIADGITDVFAKYNAAKIPAELHIYAGMGHGFGIRDSNTGPITGWPNRVLEWMKLLGF